MAQDVPHPAGPVLLGREQPFRLGMIEVVPASRQIRCGTAHETVEPRVMQVLVALAGAGGAIVTHDELIARCWGGRIVGDNAIHRVISRIRHIAASLARDSFAVETIAKVGYRIAGTDGPLPDPPPLRIGDEAGALSRTAAARRRSRRVRAAAFAAAVTLTAAASWGWWAIWTRAPERPTFAIVAADPADGRSAELAAGLSIELSRVPAIAAGRMALVAANAADYRVRVGVHEEEKALHADLGLASTVDGELLWSGSIEQPRASVQDLRVEAASKLGAVLLCAASAEAAPRPRLDRETLRLYLAACDKSRDEFEEDTAGAAAGLLRKLLVRRPRFAPALAALAGLEAANLNSEDPDFARRRAAILAEIGRARGLDPTLGETYVSEAALIPYPGGWRARLGLYDRGIALDPDFAPLHDARTEQLIRVGRIQEAVQSARRAVALDPLSADYRDSLIRALATAGNLHAAREELDREERIWPAARRSRLGRYAFELRYGDPRIALRFQDQPDLFDFANPPTDREFAAFLRARLAPTRANIDAAVAAFMPSYPRWTAGLIQTLGQFGRVDQAYRLFGPPAAMTRLSGASDVLFRPPMASIRRDRRFMTLAARIGLLRYWRDSGVWPDFCLDPGLPYNCRAEAAKLPEPRGP